MSTPSATEVAIIFVNHHSEELVVPLASEYHGAGLTVVVVDNSDTYPPGAPGHRVAPPFNLGFGQACNLGADFLGTAAPVLCLHNPDVKPCLETIRAGAAILANQARPGLVAPAEVVGGHARRDGYRYPSPARELALAASFGRRPTVGRPLPGAARGRRFAGAGLLLVWPGAWRAIGGFDTDYFMYAEDLDLWHRMSRAGFDCRFAPHLSYHHDMGQGSRMKEADREVWRWLGVELFAAKHSRAGWLPYRVVHRRWLRRVGDPESPLTTAVAGAWARNLDPVSTIEAVRPRQSVENIGRGAA